MPSFSSRVFAIVGLVSSLLVTSTAEAQRPHNAIDRKHRPNIGYWNYGDSSSSRNYSSNRNVYRSVPSYTVPRNNYAAPQVYSQNIQPQAVPLRSNSTYVAPSNIVAGPHATPQGTVVYSAPVVGSSQVIYSAPTVIGQPVVQSSPQVISERVIYSQPAGNAVNVPPHAASVR